MPSPSSPRRKNTRAAWTKAQIEALEVAVTKYSDSTGRGKWKAIAAQVPGRNDAQCRQRWEDSAKPGRKEGRWSNTEDAALVEAVEKTKHVTWRRWAIVAEAIPLRSAKQCEYRYKHHLAAKVAPLSALTRLNTMANQDQRTTPQLPRYTSLDIDIVMEDMTLAMTHLPS
ncbi:hypothetical protein SDRG_13373 [Saprolegnia diclina VS20]|uniref:Uncharacterized protein n=1 Tax=Saprolegnia diclina (strain VS20) TaxID=1156394 RepID=T0Q2T4_SAPDV|nr:hypothetical protein SDRG_13373 [Saprolegnia diclina VS20]EQC28861.1 hypothetical protein SDRG_13373 [Saprolegnia diclina VS20]|eukprot:XP_008617678.1 hypothetical protein SDRG_13373 [Saprolegnia diclina VS20]